MYKNETAMLDCTEMRLDILKMGLAAKAQGAHMGGSLSLVEILSALYGEIIRFDANNPTDAKRDRIILSKGHGAMALYAALKQIGLLNNEDLEQFKANDSKVSVHPSVHPELGIDFASGSLGQGLSLAVGMALGLRAKGNIQSRIFVILGDGEINEGSVWEAAASASFYKLSNIIAVLDKNCLQYDGDTNQVLDFGQVSDKWKSFGFDTVTCDGHKIDELVKALSIPHDKPLAVICETIKGKGVSFMELSPYWHAGVVSQKLYEQAVAEIRGAK